MRNCAIASPVAVVLLLLATAIPGLAQDIRGKGHVAVPESSIPKLGDAGKRFHTNVRAFVPLGSLHSVDRRHLVQPAVGHPPYASVFFETPGSLACIYQLVSPASGCNPQKPLTSANGGSKAIAIIDAYDYPTAASDLAKFSVQFGIPPANLQVVYASGTNPGRPCDGYDNQGNCVFYSWELEEALDIEMAHAMAPKARIYLVEAASASGQDLFTAVQVGSSLVAAAGGGEVSMSFSTGDFDGESYYDSYFTTSGVVYFGAAGDASGPQYPSTSPYVVSVGGTTVRRNAKTGDYLGQIAWEDTGGGLTFNELTPSYQAGITALLFGGRGVPDVAAVADEGVWVYDPANANSGYCLGSPSKWCILGGTSVATPVMAGIINAADSFEQTSNEELTKMYLNLGVAANLNDTTSGFCGFYLQDSATKGWDFCSGVGTPVGLQGK